MWSQAGKWIGYAEGELPDTDWPATPLICSDAIIAHIGTDEKQFHDLLAKFSCKGVGHQMTLIFADQKKREGEGGALTRWSIGPQTIQTALWPSFQPQNCPKPFSISTKTCVFTQKVITICRIDRIHYSFRRSVIWQGHKVKQQALSINNLEFGGNIKIFIEPQLQPLSQLIVWVKIQTFLL